MCSSKPDHNAVIPTSMANRTAQMTAPASIPVIITETRKTARLNVLTPEAMYSDCLVLL